MRSEAEIRKVLSATYDPEITGGDLAQDDEVLTAIQDALRWVLTPSEPDADEFIDVYVRG